MPSKPSTNACAQLTRGHRDSSRYVRLALRRVRSAATRQQSAMRCRHDSSPAPASTQQSRMPFAAVRSARSGTSEHAVRRSQKVNMSGSTSTFRQSKWFATSTFWCPTEPTSVRACSTARSSPPTYRTSRSPTAPCLKSRLLARPHFSAQRAGCLKSTRQSLGMTRLPLQRASPAKPSWSAPQHQLWRRPRHRPWHRLQRRPRR
mmetsp:Transcript_76399/g.192303  ORF Transcript_76399/g.192303 Transcript_76399/m.192303 type:complete len:204 (+) Transcript_76399:742-1353(+)